MLSRPRKFLDQRLPLPNGQSLTPLTHPTGRGLNHEVSTEVHVLHPSGLPLACGPRMERGALGLFPELQTPPLPAMPVRMGTGLEHGPGTTPTASPPSNQAVHSQRATSCRTVELEVAVPHLRPAEW